MDIFYNNCVINIFKFEKIVKIKLFYDCLLNYYYKKRKSSVKDVKCNTIYVNKYHKMICVYKYTNILYDYDTILTLVAYESSNVYQYEDLHQLLCNRINRISFTVRALKNVDIDLVITKKLSTYPLHTSVD
ncbi:hypothetical protein POWCR01_000070700 [Plasmodium ovale]|uniref:PIR protein n=1 Tax=Plasmodium ovale TaxID=36330 RepID=A0A1C3KH65_PLAOA|nr:hypothetical protein POWCR01_000070700 [Plasmodium ovale]